MQESRHGITPGQIAFVATAVLTVAAISHFYDRAPPELTFIKVLTIPLLAAGTDGLNRRWAFAEAYRKWTGAMVVRIVSMSLVLASGVTILLAGPESPLAGLIWTFVIVFVVCALITAFGAPGRTPGDPDKT